MRLYGFNSYRGGVILLLIILTTKANFFVETNSQNNNSDFQKLTVEITHLSWEKYSEGDNFTTFYVISNLTITNPNNYTVEVECPTYPHQLYGIKVNITFENKDLQAEMLCHCGGTEQVFCYAYIPKGTTTNKSSGYLVIYQPGLEELPDGDYLFSNYIYSWYWRELANYRPAMLHMKDGVPTIEYNYQSETIHIGQSRTIAGIVLSQIALIAVLSNRKRRKKEEST
ncbi:MAG: hypothetical protein ACTSXA_10490 [Candidatus Heimdallarchaeota archaeon]